MSKRLTDNLTSHYYEAYNRLRSKKSRKRIIAYVESFDDIYFWHTLLSEFENDTRYFEIMLPSRTNLTKGKKSVLKNRLFEHMGQGMIACVDADYDYLLQGCTHTSEQILKSPYVFHTYAYAIENYQCYAPSLHNVCVMATLNDSITFDFERLLYDFSKICFPLFVWSIWAYRTNHYEKFSMMDFISVIQLGRSSLNNTGAQMKHLQDKVRHKLAMLRKTFPNCEEEINSLTQEMQSLGVTPQNTYLYIQGHHLFDNIVVPLITKVCASLRHQREEEIRHNAIHITQMNNELSSYRHSMQDVRAMLRRNSNYSSCPEFQRLRADFLQFLKGLQPTTESSIRKEFFDALSP